MHKTVTNKDLQRFTEIKKCRDRNKKPRQRAGFLVFKTAQVVALLYSVVEVSYRKKAGCRQIAYL